MATVYSLVCWGGKDGKTVTMTIASPCVVSLTNHGLRDGTGVVFSTTGALPTGVTAGTTYYSRSTASGTFNLYDTEAHAKDTGSTTGRVNTSGSQSGTCTAKGAYCLGLADKSRWTTGGTERIYDGIKAWRDARYAATLGAYDTEVCEVGEKFTETITGYISMDLPCVAQIITTTVGGGRTNAYHYGVIGAGYILALSASYTAALYIQHPSVTIDGIDINSLGSDNTLITYNPSVTQGVHQSKIQYNILRAYSVGVYNTGITTRAMLATIHHNLFVSIYYGFNTYAYAGNLCLVYNNLATKCVVGFTDSSPSYNSYYYNNVSVGNTTNWSGTPGMYDAGYNFGESTKGSPWDNTSTAITTMTTDDFLDWTNNDFRPASSSAHHVNVGMVVYQGVAIDISDAVVPNYESASYPDNLWDAGPFEYDHGEGLAPSTVNISITGMASGSEIAIYKASDMSEILAPQSTTGSYSGTYTYTGDTNIIVRVRKGTSATRYLPYEYAGTITSTGFQLVVSQIPDTIAQ